MFTISGNAKDFSLAEVPLGTKAAGYLTVTDTPASEVKIPVLAAVGKARHPLLLVAAGVHANEYEGQEAVRQFFDWLPLDSLQGSFLGIPVCNVLAYEHSRRTSPEIVDGANLARIFPGDPHGTPTQRLADALFSLALNHLTNEDLFVDFHSAEETSNLLPLAGYRTVTNSSRQKSVAAAKCLTGFQLWEVKAQSGRFNSEIAERGITSVGTEITGSAGCEERDVSLYFEALRSLSGFAKVAPFPFSSHAEKKALTMGTIFAPESGFLRKRVKLGDRVTAGQVMGEIVSLTGEARGDVVATATGLVTGERRRPMIWAGDTCFWIGTEL
jgi:predicted deacylase